MLATGVRFDRDEKHLQTEILGLEWRPEFVDAATLERSPLCRNNGGTRPTGGTNTHGTGRRKIIDRGVCGRFASTFRKASRVDGARGQFDHRALPVARSLRALLDLADGVLGGAREVQRWYETETAAGGCGSLGFGGEGAQRGKIRPIA